MTIWATPGSKPIEAITVAGVLAVGLVDWLQGEAPSGIIDVGDGLNLGLFIASSIGVAGTAIAKDRLSGDSTADRRLTMLAVSLATLASMLADPTYAVLLFAVPLVHVTRCWSEPIRRQSIIGVFALALILVSLEDQSWGGNNLEAAMILFIALLLTTTLGTALGRLDAVRAAESASARRDEREQLARELHDSVGHSLLATSIQLRNAQALWDADSDGAARSVELAGRAVAEALVDTRIAVDTMRARSDPFSLSAALPELINRMSTSGLSTELRLDGPVESVDQLAQVTLYRVAQEALTNVVRHADATTVAVTHRVTDDEAVLMIADDGVGFQADVSSHRFGLRGLEERLQSVGGKLAIDSSTTSGTTVTATIGSA